MNSLVFQVDLFSARGVLPRDIQEVLARHKDILYSSRTRHNTDVYKRMNNLKADLYKARLKIPDEQLTDHERATRDSLADLPEITILQMIYQQKAYEGDSKDHEFSATSMREHWQSGLEDTRRTLKRRDWLALPEDGMSMSFTTCTAKRIIDRNGSARHHIVCRARSGHSRSYCSPPTRFSLMSARI